MPPVFHVKLNAQLILEGLSPAQNRTLRAYEELLRTRALPLGLISKRDFGRLWERHVVDSLRGAGLAAPGERVVDVGSGPGLPGIPIAIARPGCVLTLVERNQRSAAFLELASEALHLENVEIIARPAEALDLGADVCLARAVAPATAWGLAAPLLGSGGSLLYWAGKSWGAEGAAGVPDAGVSWEIFAPPEFPWQGPLVIMKASPSSTTERDDGS